MIRSSDRKSYAHEVGTLQEQFRSPSLHVTLRVWRATFAGPQAGSVIVSLEMPDLATVAKLDAAKRGDTAIAATTEPIVGLRTVVSDSLYEELMK